MEILVGNVSVLTPIPSLDLPDSCLVVDFKQETENIFESITGFALERRPRLSKWLAY